MRDNITLRVSSFNCKNVKTSALELAELCAASDIILLQETWLLDNEYQYLQELCPDFYSRSLSAMDTSVGVLFGRPHGGIAILWRKSIGSKCKIVNYDDTRILGINVNVNGNDMLFVNVYLPCDSPENGNEFISYLTILDNIVENHCSPYVYFIGDFNANLLKNAEGQIHTQFGQELLSFCEDEGYIVSDMLLLQPNSYSFVSLAHGTVSWLDHVITTTSAHEFIDCIRIDTNFVSSDHCPLFVTLDVKYSADSQENYVRSGKSVDWSQVTPQQKLDYKSQSEFYLSNIKIPGSVHCKDGNCSSKAHKAHIENFYHDIINALKRASSCLCNKKEKQSFRPVPGWNDYVRESHDQAREAFLWWQTNNKPRTGPIFDLMKTSRANFKCSLRLCKSIESRAQADALARKFLCKDSTTFWKEIKRINRTKTSLANSVNNVSGDENIAAMWKRHYSNILNCNNDLSKKDYVLKHLKNVGENYYFNVEDVRQSIKSLKLGKSAGLDALFAEHLVCAADRLIVLLSTLFTMMLQHSFIPSDLMNTVIVPILKDKKGSISDKENYRPIAVTSVVSKVVEAIILKRSGDKLDTAHNQFGFKPSHGTEMCVFALKQVIEYYKTNNSPVYVCYLDASKAFDRINHWTLFAKLIDRKVNISVIRFLLFWYEHQMFCIRWGRTLSDYFTASNGVRQGGVMSPILFNVYMDDLSTWLNNSDIGCIMNDKPINHLMYADDTCILAPSATALQKLLSICFMYARDNSILFNAKKTKCMCFKPGKKSKLYIPQVTLNKEPLKWVSDCKYLGVSIEDSGKDNLDIKRHVRSMYTRGNLLINRFKHCTDDVKTRLFQSYCSSLYGGMLWCKYTKANYKKAKVAYNDIYRGLFNVERGVSMSMIYMFSGIDAFDVIVRKYVFSFQVRLFRSSNIIISTIVTSEFFPTSKLAQEWNKKLFM